MKEFWIYYYFLVIGITIVTSQALRIGTLVYQNPDLLEKVLRVFALKIF